MPPPHVSRRHHVVPKFYLARFAASDGRLQQVWLPGDRRHSIDVSNATVVTDFYNLTTDDGQLDDFWEQQFSEIEGRAATALRHFVDEGNDSDDGTMRWDLAVFIALQHLRSTSIRNQAAEFRSNVVRLQTAVGGIERLRETMQVGLGRDVSTEELEAEWGDLTRPGGPEIVVPVEDHIAHIVDLVEPTAATIMAGGWTFWRFSRASLITSDTPVTLVPQSSAPDGFGVGVATAGGFMIPLSRKVALAVSTEYPDDSPAIELAGEQEQAAAMMWNYGTATAARRFLLMNRQDEDQLVFPLHGPITRELGDLGPRSVSREGGFGVPDPGEFDPADESAGDPGAEALGQSPLIVEPISTVRSPHFPQDGDSEIIEHYTWPIGGRTFDNPHSSI